MEDLRDNIPVPREVPWFGNVHTLRGENSIDAISDMAKVGGEIFKIKAFGIERLVCAGAEMLEELCDEKRFWKGPSDALTLIAGLQKNPRYGLFAAPTEEHMDWQIAHRVLVPAFGPLAIEKMFPEMYDIASQLVLKWARMGPDYRIPATEDFTRLTLDTISLCSMDFRFNSFYSDELHPFLQNMNKLLQITNDALSPKAIYKRLNPFDTSAQQATEAREFMTDLAEASAAA